MRHVRLPVFLALGLAALAAAPSSAAAQEPSPVAEYRAAVMQGARHHFGAVRLVVGGDVPFGSHVVQHARSLRGLATMAADVFPEGSAEGTRALPEVWTDAEGFQEKLEAFQAATEALAAAAEAMDEAALGDAVGAVGQSCRSCHTEYRADAN